MSVTVFGSINMDVVLQVERLPQPGETVTAHDIAYFPGGKGGNQAVASARFGVPTRMIGAVGGDGHGAFLRTYLADCGIDVESVAMVGGATGLAHINLSSAGENQIVVIAGANAATLAPREWTASAQGQAVAVAQLELPVPQVAVFLELSRKGGAISVLNAAPAIREAEPLLADADVLIVNETELGFYIGAVVPDEPVAAAAAARSLLRRQGQWIVVTLGAAGLIAVSHGETIVQPAPKVKVVDTVGAGDCFCGVLAGALSEGLGFTQALALAGRAASLSVQRAGAAASMPLRAEL